MVQPYLKPVPDWEEHEKPTMPGSASMPWHPPYRRAAYALVSLLVAITGGLGNALVTANLPFLQGQLRPDLAGEHGAGPQEHEQAGNAQHGEHLAPAVDAGVTPAG